MEVIKDGVLLRKLAKAFGFTYDRKHKYVVDSGPLESSITSRRELQSKGHDLRYFDGCFCPFLVKT